ncbi:NACHT domain-containing protein [Amycolatopsis taiwanensis]|uniref:NACHT domain-containing protein n=1 Tax=Amycolatopsis taiwanensis TaxID=342230 RepID=UPI0004ACD6C6|nr:NACHT domain-containing protein [Amycolatopsis taiwanensis]
MPEPTLALLVAQSAAKAVGGLATRAAVPVVRSTAERLRPAPAAVRRDPNWREVKLARSQQEELSRYLRSRVCTGLLQILAHLELSGQTPESERDRARVAESFRAELAARLKLPAEQIERIASVLWIQVHDRIRLEVEELRSSGALADEDLVHLGYLQARSIDERLAISGEPDRVVNAHAAVRVIGKAMHDRYAKMVMPHSREDYRVPIEQIYVTRALTPRAEGQHGDVVLAPIPERDIHDRRFVVVGHPGAGKSTFIRYMLYLVSSAEDEAVPLAGMVVDLKDHPSPQESYVGILAESLRVITQSELAVEAVRDVLLLGLGVVVFDGLDEISDIGWRRSTVEAIEAFSRRYPLVTVVVTSRDEGYTRARLDPALFPVYHLPDFTDEQVRRYVERWFSLGAGPREFQAEERVRNFLADSLQIADLRTNPLMLSLLCMIYEYEGYIPENRPQVYEQCAELLFERWDRVRRVPISFKANMQTRYLVQELAYHFFNQGIAHTGETETRLREIVKDYFQRNIVGEVSSALGHAQDFIDFCAGRAWLLTQTGVSERGERLFGFTHRTFLEYFAACFMVRHCDSPRDLVSLIRPMIQFGVSDVVPQIAIQQFDARRADGIDDCLELLLDRADHSANSYRSFVDFALRSLRFMRPGPRTLQRLYSSAVILYGQTKDPDLLVTLLSAPADTFELMLKSCETLRSRQRSSEVEFGAIVVSALLRRIENGEDTAGVVARLAEPDGHRSLIVGSLRGMGGTAPDLVVELNRQGLLPAAELVRTIGARMLVSAPAEHGHQAAPGPLVIRLREFFSAGEFHAELREMLAEVAADPGIVLPLGEEVLRELAEMSRPPGTAISSTLTGSVKPFEREVVLQNFPVGPESTPAWSAGFHLLFVSALAASYEMDARSTTKTDLWRRIALELPVLRELVLGQLTKVNRNTALHMSQLDLGACLVRFLVRLDAPNTWRSWFTEWREGNVKALTLGGGRGPAV